MSLVDAFYKNSFISATNWLIFKNKIRIRSDNYVYENISSRNLTETRNSTIVQR